MPKTENTIFLSHNSADKNYVRKFAVSLKATGANVWFDEWTIRPGDSIPSLINDGLSQFNTFVLVWSDAASKSQWVKAEMEGAITRWIGAPSIRLVPVVLDETPLPVLLQPIKYINGSDGDHFRVARELLGISSETDYLLAVQAFIDEAGFEFREFEGVGVLVACPKCGTTLDNLEPWGAVDHDRDDHYAGVRCKVCGWSDGSEI